MIGSPTIPAHDIDRQTDGQTDRRTELAYQYRALHSCAVIAARDKIKHTTNSTESCATRLNKFYNKYTANQNSGVRA